MLQEVDRKQNVWCGNETPFLKKYVKSSVDEGIVFLAGVKGWKTPLCVPVSESLILRAHPQDLIFPYSPLSRPSLQTQSHSEIQGVRTPTYEWEAGTQFNAQSDQMICGQ